MVSNTVEAGNFGHEIPYFVCFFTLFPLISIFFKNQKSVLFVWMPSIRWRDKLLDAHGYQFYIKIQKWCPKLSARRETLDKCTIPMAKSQLMQFFPVSLKFLVTLLEKLFRNYLKTFIYVNTM